MVALNTIPREEYAERLSKAALKVAKKLGHLSFEEELKSKEEENKGPDADAEKYLDHKFRAIALTIAQAFLTKSPHEFLNLKIR